MRIGLKILLPQIVLFALLALGCALLLFDAGRRQESMRTTRLHLQAAAEFANRLERLYSATAAEVLSYRLDREPLRKESIDLADIAAHRILVTYVATANAGPEKRLLEEIAASRQRVVASRNELMRSIDSAPEASIHAAFERWRIHASLLRAQIEDLTAYDFHRFEEVLGASERESLGIVHTTIYGLLAAMLMVAAWYFHLQRAVSRPLARLSRGIEDFGRGRLQVRIDAGVHDADDEIALLAGTFNRMAGQIEELNQGMEKKVRERTAQLEVANKELEAFSYSASHDLRAPLQTIDGFSRALEEDYANMLDAEAKDFLARIRKAAQRMAQLIDDLLKLSRISRAEITKEPVNLSVLAEEVVAELRERSPDRVVTMLIAPGLQTSGDRRLLRVLLENLLGNAWKFTSGRSQAKIEFAAIETNGETVYFIHDNGAGFDMAHAGKLFLPFQRLHSAAAFPGTGIGLATVRRIVQRHGGRIWGEGTVGQGATFHFTLSGEAQ